MRANAFKAWATSDAGRDVDLQVKVHQTLEDTTPVFRFGVAIYNHIQRTLPYLQYIYYQALEWLGVTSKAWKIPGGKRFQDVVHEFKPDVVLSTHDHLNHGFFDLARAACPDSPPSCITYCGELEGSYGFSRWWVNPAADLFIGAVEETCQAAERHGMDPRRIWRGGFLLYPPFYDVRLSAEARSDVIRGEWDLDPNQFILLIGTGANAANNHINLLRAIVGERLKIQVLVLCGKSAVTRQRIEQFSSEHPDLPIRAIGYTTEMAKLMQCSNAVVARPGTGTTSEAIQSGCPILFNGIGGIMPQEVITVKYCQKHGVGYVFKNAKGFAQQLKVILEVQTSAEGIDQAQIQIRPDRSPMEILAKVASLGPRRDILHSS